MSRNYKFNNPEGAYFVSFATVNWVNLFESEAYVKILADAISYCRKEKGLLLYAYVFMPNHVHLLFRSANCDPTGFLRDFKGYTSRQLIKAIKENPLESRREYLLNLFERAGARRSNVKQYQLWQQDNQQVEVYSNWVVEQKVNYIHQNPVKKGLVANAVDWRYSSARNYAGDQTVLAIDLMSL